MSEFERLDDADLRDFERRLLATPLSLTSERRAQLLFACGRQAGLTEARRQLRRWTATTAVLGVFAGAMAMLAIADRPASSLVENDSERDSQVATSNPERPLPPLEKRPLDSGRIPKPSLERFAASPCLTAGMDVDRALALLDARSAPTNSSVNSAREPSHRPLRLLMEEMP